MMNIIKSNTWLIRPLLKFLIWVVGQYIALEYGVEKLYFMASVFVLIFTNLGQRKPGELSAYSIFNPNMERLAGTLTSEHIDNMLGGKLRPTEDRGDRRPQQQQVRKYQQGEEEDPTYGLRAHYLRYKSKLANTDCYCGSKLKYKKCCFLQDQQEERLAKLGKRVQ